MIEIKVNRPDDLIKPSLENPMPKVGEYWHISVPVTVTGFDGSSHEELYSTVAKCVSRRSWN